MNRLRLAMGWLILTAWGLSFVVTLVDPTREIPNGLQVLATMVAGALFAPSLLHRKNGNKEDNSD